MNNLWRLFGSPLIKFSPVGLSGGKIFNCLRIIIARTFGAKIGANVILHPCNIHFPWKIEIADNSWIGEGVILYSLDDIKIGENVCVSQYSFFVYWNA